MIPTRSGKVLYFSNNDLKLLDVEVLQEAKKCVVRIVQSKYFNEEWKLLKMKTRKM